VININLLNEVKNFANITLFFLMNFANITTDVFKCSINIVVYNDDLFYFFSLQEI
jgi:hypothetical protein